MRLLSYNIQHGGVGREAAIGTVIRACSPDIVILQEATRPDVVDRLGEACGMKTWGAIRGHSLAFLSRDAVSHHAWHHVPWAKRRYLEVSPAGSDLRIFGVHLAAVHSNLTERRRAYELRSVLSGIAGRRSGVHVITGDFNTLAPGEKLDIDRLPPRLRAIVWMTGRTIRWTTIQLMLDGGYTDAYRMFHSDEGFTFPTWDPHVRLDYAFLQPSLVPQVTRCEVMRDVEGVRQASDHFPLLTEWA